MPNYSSAFIEKLATIEDDGVYKFLLTEKRQTIQRLVNLYRGQILDAVELYAGKSLFWPSLRSRLLNLLGDKGLQQAILGELERSFGGERAQEQDGGEQ